MNWLTSCAVSAGIVAAGIVPAWAEAPAPTPSVAEIVARNAAAMGGPDAWRRVHTLARAGRIETSGDPNANLRFVMEEMRPDKTRFELTVHGQKSLRIHDGKRGWKVRPGGDGIPELKPFTDAELKYARDNPVIDGPLMDYQARGVAVSLDGVDEVEGHPAYRLVITLPSGEKQHLWIDAQSYLELKSDRVAQGPAGASGTITVHYRDYHAVEGLQFPFVIETGNAAAKERDRMLVERIIVNPPLGERTFAKPGVPSRRNLVTITADNPSGDSLPSWAGQRLATPSQGPANAR